MKNELSIPDEIITSKIHFIREQKVMLDRDLADLYQVETKQLKRQVRGNIQRFPEDFMFELSQQEFDLLRCQNGSSSWGGTRYSPMALTEQGVAMLSSVLNSERETVADGLDRQLMVDHKKLTNHSKNIELVFNYLDELIDKKENPKSRPKIGYL